MKTELSLGQWATEVPGASRILRRYGLDFCCGGKKSLSEGCKDLNIDLSEVLLELETLEVVNSQFDWSVRPLAEITDHIITFYHDKLRLMLPELIFLADKVQKVHADHKQCPKGLAQKLEEVKGDLFDHMMKEEQILFPLIKNGQGQHAYVPIKVMQEEHDIHGSNLKEIKRIAFDFVPPEGACGTWRALYRGLDQLELELMEHINLENNVLFLRALRG